MPTTGKVKGKLIKVWIDDDPVSLGGAGNKQLAGCQTDSNVNLSTSELEATCKDDGNFSDANPDENSATIDLSLLTKFDATLNLAEIRGFWSNQTICELTVGTGVTGDPEMTAIAFLTSANEGKPLQGIATIDTSWRVKGAPTFGTTS